MRAEEKPIRIVIVEDQKEVREGLRYLLSLDPRVRVAQVYDRAEGLIDSFPTASPPDLVLMDIGLPGISGIAAAKAIREKAPTVRILILTVFEDEEKLLDSIRAGANGYVLKNTKPEILLEQIVSAAGDGSPLSPEMAGRLLENIRRSDKPNQPPDYGFTPREKQILAEVVDGLTAPEIAAKHGIAHSTAKKHILHLYQKLGASTRGEFVRKAIRENLV